MIIFFFHHWPYIIFKKKKKKKNGINKQQIILYINRLKVQFEKYYPSITLQRFLDMLLHIIFC